MDMTAPEHLLRQIDTDADETTEWIEALNSVIASAGPERARFLLTHASRRT
jgi:pyruvate dehydrogenase E1 component